MTRHSGTGAGPFAALLRRIAGLAAMMALVASVGCGAQPAAELVGETVTEPAAHEQGPAGPSGVIGTVTDARSGRPVEGAVVSPASLARPPRPVPLLAAVSDAQGRYRWRLAPGEWELTASAPGYRDAVQPVRVSGEGPTTLDLTLEPA